MHWTFVRYLIYAEDEEDDIDAQSDQFNLEDFLAEQPADWVPFLRQMTSTQSFSVFIDERISDVTGQRGREVRAFSIASTIYHFPSFSSVFRCGFL